MPSSVQRLETFQKILTLPGKCQEDVVVLKLLAWFPVDRPNTATVFQNDAVLVLLAAILLFTSIFLFYHRNQNFVFLIEEGAQKSRSLLLEVLCNFYAWHQK